MSRFESAGLELHYEDCGVGEAVVLLHGFTSSFAGTWKHKGWVGLLTGSGRRVVGLDFPGHGESEGTYDVERCSPERLAADVVALLDHVELDVVDLVGFSMGAGVALRVAMKHPERVRRVAVGGIGDAAVSRLHDPRRVAEIAAAFRREDVGVADPVAGRIRRNAELAGNDLRALLPFLQGSGWPGGLDELLPISASVLLFVAGGDEYMAKTETIERWLGHAEVLVLRGRDHHSVTLDDELRSRVVGFLNAKTRPPQAWRLGSPNCRGLTPAVGPAE